MTRDQYKRQIVLLLIFQITHSVGTLVFIACGMVIGIKYGNYPTAIAINIGVIGLNFLAHAICKQLKENIK